LGFQHFIVGKSLPWLGIDIGGTLAKVAYFEYYENGDNIEYLGNNHAAVQQFIKSTHQYGSEGERDARLELKDVQLGTRKGNLHFIRFPTSRMDAFLEVAEAMRTKEFLHKTVYATGGGAYKFEKEFKEVGAHAGSSGFGQGAQWHSSLKFKTLPRSVACYSKMNFHVLGPYPELNARPCLDDCASKAQGRPEKFVAPGP
jgi:hypothetical protein